MSRFRVSGQFDRQQAASDAVRVLRETGLSPSVEQTDLADTSARETRFMGRIFLIVVFWSVIGTAAGAVLGVVLHLTIGPSGTEGLIIQVVTWAIFAHLIIGMCAGYLLLADRTEQDLPAIRAHDTRVVVECDSIDGAERAAACLRDAGATDVMTTGALTPSAKL